jgi:hypothetical protein
MKKYWILSALIFLSLLTACGTQALTGPRSLPEVQARPTTLPPNPDMTTVIGQVVSSNTGLPMADTIVRLAEIVRQDGEGAFILDVGFSPGAITDEMGYFVMENISVKEYLVVVGNVETNYEIIVNPDGSAKTYETQGGSILDVGRIESKLK